MSTRDPSIAVLGAGNVGLALAGQLTLDGFNVSLGELPQFEANIFAPMKRGGIEVTGELNTGFAKIDTISTDIGKVVGGRDLIFVTSIAFGQEAFTKMCAPNIENGQALIYISYFSALRMAKLIKELVPQKDIVIGETLSSYLVSDRIGKRGAFFADLYQDESKVQIKRFKEGLPIAAFPANRTDTLLCKVKKINLHMTAGSNVLETSILNVNPPGHLPGVLLNAGWIEHTKGGFTFTLEGCTPAIKKVMQSMNAERKVLAEAFNIDTQGTQMKIDDFYSIWLGDPERRRLHEKKYYQNVHDAPPNLKHRYLTEDIYFGLVPMSYLAEVVGVETPTFNSLVHLSNLINEISYWKEGVTLEKLGLDSMNTEQILKYVTTGS